VLWWHAKVRPADIGNNYSTDMGNTLNWADALTQDAG